MTTTDIFRRVLWKEYRVLRAFWIAVVAIVLAVEAFAWLLLASGEATQTFEIVASVFIALYALAAGAILFAVEREDGTDTFLTTLPVGSARLFFPKVVLAIASTLALAAVLLLVIKGWQAAGAISPAEHFNGWSKGQPRDPLALAAIACDVFVCGLLCSLLLKRPLIAACVGAGVAVLVTYFGTFITNLIAEEPVRDRTPGDYGWIWSVTVFSLSAGVFLIDIAVGQRWLEWGTLRIKRRRTISNSAEERAAAATKRAPRGPTWRGAFGRLVWQELRQTWRMMAIYFGIAMLLTAWMVTPDGARDTNANSAMILTGFFTALMGASTFYADQERSQFRFFGERPVRPRMVWGNRLVVWFTVITLVLVVATPLWVAIEFGNLTPLIQHMDNSYVAGQRTPGSFNGTLFQLPAALTFVVLVSLTYASGQLCSMLLRSGIIAAFLGVILAAVFVAWSIGMSVLGVNWLISIAPLPIILLWVTWLRAPHWIAERSGWWPWTRLSLSLAVPLVAVGAATVSFRMFQFPRTGPGFSPEQYVAEVTPDARETAQMYLRAASLMDMSLWAHHYDPSLGRGDYLVASLAGLLDTAPYYTDAEARRDWIKSYANPRQQNMLAWLAANREPLALALEATARPSCAFGPSGRDVRAISELEDLIGTEAYRLIEAGDLQGAFDCELALLRMSSHLSNHQFRGIGERVALRTLDVIARYWGTRPGQSPDLLRRGIAAIQKWRNTAPRVADALKATNVWDERLLALDPDAVSEQAEWNSHLAVNLQRYTFIYHLMPWEVFRARRALDYLTYQKLANVQAIETAVRVGEPTARLEQQQMRIDQSSVRQTTPLLNVLTYGFWGGGVRLWLEQQAQLNCTLILLALEGHRREHGSLPLSLDELVGDYFEKLPRDPYSGDSFRYFPHGMPKNMKIRHGLIQRWDWPIAAGVPFLWSSGPDVLPITRRNSIDDVYAQLNWIGEAAGAPTPLLEMLPNGWATTIPQPGGAVPLPVDGEHEQNATPADGDVPGTDDDHQDDAAPPPAESHPDETPAEPDSSGEPLH